MSAVLTAITILETWALSLSPVQSVAAAVLLFSLFLSGIGLVIAVVQDYG